MKVKDLIIELQSLNPELEVIIAADSEGNNYGPFLSFDKGMYVPKNKWSGSFKGHGDCEWEEIEYKENAVVFWPAN